MPNQGEYDFVFSTTEGQQQNLTFKVADVNNALGSVPHLVGIGYRVIVDKDSQSGLDVSVMINKGTNEHTKFRRDRNVWVLDAIVEAEVAAIVGRQA